MGFDIKNYICDLVRFPSVSADSSHISDVRACAEFIADKFSKCGFQAETIETARNPIILLKRNCPLGNPSLRVLCYAHYDVQPPDPIEKWRTPPFEPVEKDGKIWGRGTADNKGPSACLMGGLLNFLEKNPNAPIDIAVIFDGEEEIGSPSMNEYVAKHKEFFSGYDILLLSDTSAISSRQPILTIGLRGTASFDAIFRGPNTDVHSGMFGGAVYNPLQAMCEVCASLHAPNGMVNIPNFYDGIEKLEEWERSEIAKNPFGDEEIKRMLNVKSLYHQAEYTPSEALRALPSVELTGMGGGYQGEGSKSVIPSECFCKFSCRTVFPQKTRDVVDILKKTIASRTPPGIEVSFIDYESGGNAYYLNPKNLGDGRRAEILKKAFEASRKSSEKTFGNPPIMLREGASIPLISHIKDLTGLDSLMFGLFSPEDNLHAPNEGFSLEAIQNGAAYYEMFFEEMIKNA